MTPWLLLDGLLTVVVALLMLPIYVVMGTMMGLQEALSCWNTHNVEIWNDFLDRMG